jgi:hypothetical protein
MMDKVIIRQSNNTVWLSDDPKWFARYVYENNLKIIRLLYSYASKEFLEDITHLSQEELVECLITELDEDHQTIVLN